MVEGERRISKGEATSERKSTREKCRSQSHATDHRAAKEGGRALRSAAEKRRKKKRRRKVPRGTL